MAAQTEPIRGKVAKILSHSEVVLNIGKKHNVQIGMLFDILMQGYDEIKDPDTGEVLGGIDRPKARVKVVSANDRLSIAATYRKERVNVGGPEDLGIRLRGDLLPPPRWETRVETFPTREAVPEDHWSEDLYVATGDPVVQVDEPYEDVDDLPF